MPATVPEDIARALKNGEPAPAGLSAKETSAYEAMNRLYTRGGGYAGAMVTRPQTLGYSLSDSPVGQAAWFYDKFADWTFSGGMRAGATWLRPSQQSWRRVSLPNPSPCASKRCSRC